MALFFEDWYRSFLELQPLLELPRMEMSQMLRQNMKGPKDVHPRDVRDKAMKHQQNIQAQKQKQWLEEQRTRQANRPQKPNNQNQTEKTNREANTPGNKYLDRTEDPDYTLTGANREPI